MRNSTEQIKRAQAIQAEYIRKLEQEAKESRKAAARGAVAGVESTKTDKPETEDTK